MADIFISYARKDKDWVFAFVKILENKGYHVDWDQSILPGENFIKSIERRVKSAKCVYHMVKNISQLRMGHSRNTRGV